MIAKDLRSKSKADLIKKLAKLREKQAKMQLERITKDSSKPSEFANVRKDIAVVKTVIRENELEINKQKSKAGAKDA